MKTINIKPPEWAKNLDDKNFLVMAKRIMHRRPKNDK